MIIKHFKKDCIALILLLGVIHLTCYGQQLKMKSASQNHNIVLGAYYFDGWTQGSHHITEKLKNQFENRKPVWGWETSTPSIVNAQINAAADAGLRFFAFDWYFRNGSDNYPLNNALNLYLSSPDKNRLQFCLMVANHTPFFISPDNWSDVSKIWIKLFKDREYLKVNGKPLLIFFSVHSLIEEFSSTAAVKEAFETLKKAARKAGLKGVSIAACVYDNAEGLQEAEDCGFDILTGYNYHDDGLEKGQEATPIDSMRVADMRVWDGINHKSKLSYIPNITLNWDPRPWRPDTVSVPHFTGYSKSSVYKSVSSAMQWINNNKEGTTREKIIVMYAWNENGEGGWLTPSETLRDGLLQGVKEALSEENK